MEKLDLSKKYKHYFTADRILVDDLEDKIIEILNGKTMTAKQITDKLKINISPKSLSVKLKDNPKIDSFKKGRLLHFKIKNSTKQGTLFK